MIDNESSVSPADYVVYARRIENNRASIYMIGDPLSILNFIPN